MSTTALVIVGIVLLGGSALVMLWLLASHARSSAETAGSGVGETSTPHPATEEPAAGMLGSPVVSVASVISESPHGALDSASPAAAPQSFESCVQRGFGLLARGEHEDGVAEFHEALALIDDREMKVRLHIVIGNAYRSQRMYEAAGAAYLQATLHTDHPMLLEHLERIIAEMMDSDDVGAADTTSEPEKEE